MMDKIKNFIVRRPYVSSILLPIVFFLIPFFSAPGFYVSIILVGLTLVLIVTTIFLVEGKKKIIIIIFWLLPFLLIVFAIWAFSPNLSGLNFDPILWDEKELYMGDYRYPHRCKMAKDLQNNLNKQKMSKEEVLKLLGEDGKYMDKSKSIIYPLGMCRSMDYYVFVISFDNKNIIEKVTISEGYVK